MRLHIHKKQVVVVASIVALVFACSTDELVNPLDVQLKEAISRVSPTGHSDFFVLPHPSDYKNIPQEPKNPLSDVKVELGKLLFYETGFALDPKYPLGKGTYSCSSCHIPEAGFMPGREQGIADGGTGFGLNGEGRTKFSVYQNHEPDIQGARALSIMNVAFVPNTTWSGQFGSGDNNLGTESVWTEEQVKINALGMQALESQIIEGIKVHRMVFNQKTVDTLGYKHYFDSSFPEIPASQRYTTTTASFALSAYLRTLISNEAPFQNWLKGDGSSMSDGEKRGALLFFGKAGCYKCHNGNL